MIMMTLEPIVTLQGPNRSNRSCHGGSVNAVNVFSSLRHWCNVLGHTASKHRPMDHLIMTCFALYLGNQIPGRRNRKLPVDDNEA
jgi:hypothetical protein